jgi:hypothetical protein
MKAHTAEILWALTAVAWLAVVCLRLVEHWVA